VRDAGSMRRTFAEFKPDLVLHLSALVDLEFCELHRAEVENINRTATGAVARLAAEYGARLVYKWGTPTYTHNFAMNLFALLDRGAYGLYHMVCRGIGTRFDVAKEIVAICRRKVEVKPVASSFFGERFFAPRPGSEILFNHAFENRGINLMRDWRVALR
jgi:dTDP-4-dehydrorhamnose reductase